MTTDTVHLVRREPLGMWLTVKESLQAQGRVLDSIPISLRLGSDFLTQYPPGSDVSGVPEACGLLTQHELRLTDLKRDATEVRISGRKEIISSLQLRDALAKGEITSVAVTTAFLKRACIAHQVTTCLTAVFWNEALERARQLDTYLEKNNKPIGPLHGLPISLKDAYPWEGQVTTASFLAHLHEPPAANSCAVVQALWDAGAVFHAKTTLPQAIMHLETNSFWGETKNPFNTALTPGGSSGGCSALVAMGGAPVSLGGDIGGSLRTPAASCGLWTLKMTCNRIPKGGNKRLMSGNDGVGATAGPIARSARDVELFITTVLGNEPWLAEWSLPPVPWRHINPPPIMKIGVMMNDGVVKPFPAMERGMSHIVNVLKDDPRVLLVPFKGWKHAVGVELVHQLYFPDGGKTIRKLCEASGEPILPLTEWVLTRPGVKELVAAREAFKVSYNQYFLSTGIDLLLCPSGYSTAPLLGTSKYWGYVCIWNLLDYPAATFPTGLRSTAEDMVPARSAYWSADDEQVWSSCAYLKDHVEVSLISQVHPAAMTNAPICAQLVGKQWQDEMVMEGVKLITESL